MIELDTKADRGAKIRVVGVGGGGCNAINSMIDITSTRVMAARIHPAFIMYVLLFILGLGCALIAGIRMANAKRRSWLHIFVFAVVMCASVYIILALEYPRRSS